MTQRLCFYGRIIGISFHPWVFLWFFSVDSGFPWKTIIFSHNPLFLLPKKKKNPLFLPLPHPTKREKKNPRFTFIDQKDLDWMKMWSIRDGPHMIDGPNYQFLPPQRYILTKVSSSCWQWCSFIYSSTNHQFADRIKNLSPNLLSVGS